MLPVSQDKSALSDSDTGLSGNCSNGWGFRCGSNMNTLLNLEREGWDLTLKR